MSEQYARELLRLAVAQICQTIGYNATQTSSLELLQDLLHRFLNEFARDLHRQVEHDNRTTACLEDVTRTFSSLHINLHELLDYVSNVEPVPFAVDVPKFPVNKPSNLNFLKPGSKEVLSRPVHIFEHLPPMLPPDTTQLIANDKHSSVLQTKAPPAFGTAADASEQTYLSATTEEQRLASSAALKIKNEPDSDRAKLDMNVASNTNTILSSAMSGKALQLLDEHGRRTREILSVVMTTGGFISPAVEGKLPETGIPTIVEKFMGLDAPPPPAPPAPISLSDTINKTEKSTLEPSQKSNIGKEISTAAAKNSFSNIDNSDKSSKIEETINVETNISPKKIGKQNMKKAPSTQPNPTQQPIALKLLKKAKKKNSALGANTAEGFPNSLTEAVEHNAEKMNEKACRKRLKMLQKMLKNSQTQQGASYWKKEIKKMKSLLHTNVPLFNEIPAGIEGGVRMEKMLKKQAKQKQKELKKQQLTLETQRSNNFPQANNDVESGLKQTTIQQAEGTALKIEKKHETKQANLSMSKQPIPAFLTNAEQAQIENLPAVPTLGTTSQISELEIKLSNEPDRSKLNIFKKITKAQKAAQMTPPIKQAMPTNSFTGSEGQIINLPTGTTITPAPQPFIAPVNTISPKMNYQDGSLDGTTLNNAATVGAEVINKPKKRGRKPGSKNQPKVLLEPNLQTVLGKKPKKTKTPNVAKHAQMPVSLEQNPTAAPLSYGKLEAAQTPFPHTPQIFPTLKAQRKERKEKEKSKILEMFPNFPDVAPIKDEPVNLSGIKMSPLDMQFISKLEKNMPSSPQKPRKRQQSNSQVKSTNPPTPTMLPPFLPGATVNNSFPQLPTNMLSMLPFAFPPRPGLIPGPGLVPTAACLSNFASQLSNNTPGNVGAAAGLLGLGPPFYPFPTMKPQNVAAVLNQNQERNTKERVKEPPTISTPYTNAADRSYCNVAPLVPPETIKPVTEHIKNVSNPLLPGVKQQPKNTLPGKVPLLDGQINTNEQIANELYTPAVNNFLRKARMATNQPIGNPTNVLADLKSTEKHAPTGSADDPIEVSDDSDETAMQTEASVFNTFNLTPLPTLNTHHMPSNPSNPELSMLTSPKSADLPINLAGTQESVKKMLPKDAKKIKKIQKHGKKSTQIVANEPMNNLEVFSASCSNIAGTSSDGFSKLAGGADLIPISVTGTAYSARSIPSTSLTASRPLNLNNSAYEQTRKELATETDKGFSDVTIIPNVQKKKSKEHKKLRKLKDVDGIKVKKKKDKKDKIKNKQLLAYALVQENTFEKPEDKEILKKLKKERKKQKQRLTTTHSNEPTQANVQSLTPNAQFPLSMFGNLPTEISPTLLHSTTQTTVPTLFSNTTSETTAQTLVPKLTLKIGNSQSPTPTLATKADEEVVKIATPKREPSPELARFSPLVTRPPKQKIPQTDNPLTSFTIPNAESNPTVKPADNIALTTHTVIPPPSPWLAGGTLTASSVLLPQQLMTSAASKPKADINTKTDSFSSGNTNAPRSGSAAVPGVSNQNTVPLIAETNRPSSYVDAEGNTVWICPACGKVDDGSPMIGCDGCDAWYHWECVGIAVAPNDNEDWFCRVCITRKKGFHGGGDGSEKKRKRNKKK